MRINPQAWFEEGNSKPKLSYMRYQKKSQESEVGVCNREIRLKLGSLELGELRIPSSSGGAISRRQCLVRQVLGETGQERLCSPTQ